MVINSIIVLDYGAQYTQLIVRRLRELNVYALILPATATLAEIQAQKPKGVVLSGGPGSVYDQNALSLPKGLLTAGLPILAICYGMQLLAYELKGKVIKGNTHEYGKAILNFYQGKLFNGIKGEFVAWMSHGDLIEKLPEGFEVVATTASTPIAGMQDANREFYALQFHPEVQHTPQGTQLIENFIKSTGINRVWQAGNITQQLVAEVKEQVGSEQVLLAISGGVDSSTLGLLLHKAIKTQLSAIFVDHGLLRANEAKEVEEVLIELGLDLTVIDASEQFLQALKGISDPEEKRKVIGSEFIKVFSQAAKNLKDKQGNIKFLAQGTLYPDVIESAGGHGTANIKSHHNVGGLPTELNFELLEPFRTLLKDEVRQVAKTLGLPDKLRLRHPFPGPGLAVRCLGEITVERLDILRRVDKIFIDALHEANLYHNTWQALAVLTPLQTVGVMGDSRTYSNTVALRAVSSVDGMTADWTHLPHKFLASVSNSIVNKVPEVNRVVFDITSKPPGTIEWE